MKLKFKSLQGSTFVVDAELSDTIASLKSKIETAHGHQASAQKIIYSGKILTDGDTVQSCGVSEKDFLVLMVSKPKAPKAAAAAPVAAASAAPAVETAKEVAPVSTDSTSSATAALPPFAAAPAESAPAAGTTTEPATATSGPPGSSQFLTGSSLEQAVNNIVEMGFEKSEVQKAMRASFNNPERAVEYLMTGIPEHLNRPPQAAAPAATAATDAAPSTPAPASATGATTAPGAPARPSTNPRAGNLFEAAAAQAQEGGARGGDEDDEMSHLRELGEDDGNGTTTFDLNNPAMIAQLRQLVRQNPAALAPLAQALAQSNPNLASALADNPEALLSMLASNSAEGGDAGEEGISLPSIEEMSPEDQTAVQQIIAMGIDETKAIEVYLMCGRNVEMAVQYYFENPQDFED